MILSPLRSAPLLIAALALSPAGIAQVVIIDSFNVGNFIDPGTHNNVVQSQTGPATDIVGGQRFELMVHGGSAYLAGVEAGRFEFAASAGSVVLELGWGNIKPLEVGRDLHLDLSSMVATGGFVVNVASTQLAGPEIFQFEVASSLVNRSDSPLVDITKPGTYFFPFASFTQSASLSEGPANFKDINTILFRLPSQTVQFGQAGGIGLNSIIISPVPEPATAGIAAAAGLLGFALWRKCRKP